MPLYDDHCNAYGGIEPVGVEAEPVCEPVPGLEVAEAPDAEPGPVLEPEAGPVGALTPDPLRTPPFVAMTMSFLAELQ